MGTPYDQGSFLSLVFRIECNLSLLKPDTIRCGHETYSYQQLLVKGLTPSELCRISPSMPTRPYPEKLIHVIRWVFLHKRQNQQNDMCAQQRLKSAWASAQSEQSLRCPPEESLGLKPSIERTAKTLIRLGECPGWSESLLGAHVILLVLSWGGSNMYPHHVLYFKENWRKLSFGYHQISTFYFHCAQKSAAVFHLLSLFCS